MADLPASPSRAALLAKLALPALVVGVASSLILLVVEYVAEALQHLLWELLPGWLGLAGAQWWWTIVILTVTGVAAGLVAWRIPMGPDPATEGLVGPPLPVGVLPGMLVATVLTLAGGVSLGPENPITAVNVALAVAIGGRYLPALKPPLWLGLGAAGTIGALFGTPVAAALILSELALGPQDEPLWDRLFAPLLAAGAGAATTVAIHRPVFGLEVPDYTLHGGDVITGAAVAVGATLLGLSLAVAFPYVHRLLHRLRHPLVRLAFGGLLLGLLGAIGGQITLFKGLSQMKELTANVAAYTAAGLALIIVVKLVALLIAATVAFVGGRIFPAVFVGVAFGLLVHTLVPGIPMALAISCSVLGIVLAVTQQGWLSLFMGAVMTTDTDLLPVLCLAILPAWLLVTGKPPMLIPEEQHQV